MESFDAFKVVIPGERGVAAEEPISDNSFRKLAVAHHGRVF
jgi:hypothetical protein